MKLHMVQTMNWRSPKTHLGKKKSIVVRFFGVTFVGNKSMVIPEWEDEPGDDPVDWKEKENLNK